MDHPDDNAEAAAQPSWLERWFLLKAGWLAGVVGCGVVGAVLGALDLAEGHERGRRGLAPQQRPQPVAHGDAVRIGVGLEYSRVRPPGAAPG